MIDQYFNMLYKLSFLELLSAYLFYLLLSCVLNCAYLFQSCYSFNVVFRATHIFLFVHTGGHTERKWFLQTEYPYIGQWLEQF